MNEQIVILDFGSQYTQVIARRIRECNVYSTILRYNTPAVKIAALQPRGIILSGGPSSVYAKDAPLPDKNIFSARRAGARHLLRRATVRAIPRRQGRERPETRIRQGHAANQGFSPAHCFPNLPEQLQVWNSHGDKLTKLPRGFKPVAVTENSPFAAIENRARKLFGLQFHPEVVHTPRGKEIISNFVHKICGCGKSWTMRNYVEQAVAEIRRQVGGEKVILGLSGGVDSSVAAALLHKAIGNQLTCIFVNNGVLRAREAETVQEVFGRNFKIKLQYEDASKLFLKRLKGVTDPERKRKIIGRTFIEVFEKAVAAFVKTRTGQPRFDKRSYKFLAQGTLYPDVIESVPIAGNPAAMIKSHHNVGGLPKKMKLQLVEPLKCLVQGRSPPARTRTRPAEGNRLSPAVPRPRPGRALPRRSDAGKIEGAPPRRRDYRGGDEGERALLQDVADVRRCCCPCAAWACRATSAPTTGRSPSAPWNRRTA